MTIRPIFAWYDLWVGLFWDQHKRRLYVFPMPMLGESGRLQLRFEWFNFFNHTQFNNPNATFNTPTFGLVTSTLDPRILQIAGRLQW